MITVKIASLVGWDPSPEVYQLLVERLNDEDCARIGRYRRRPDRLCFLVGRLLLLKSVKELLAEAASLPGHLLQTGVTQIVLGYNSFGKPFLVQPEWHNYRIEFNITHDDQVVMLVVCKFAKDQEGQAGVGVDIMRVDRTGVDAEGLEEVLIEQLHPSEFAVFRTTPQLTSPTPHSPGAETARLDYLIRMWTAKEAYTKAIGTGLGTEFKEISLVGLDHLDRGHRMVKICKDAALTSLQIETTGPGILALAPPINKDWNIAHGDLIVHPDLHTDDGSTPSTRFAWSIVAPSDLNIPSVRLDDILKFVFVRTSHLEAMAVAKGSS